MKNIKSALFIQHNKTILKQEIEQRKKINNDKKEFTVLCGSALFELFYRQHKLQNETPSQGLSYMKATPLDEILSDYPKSVREYIYTILRNIDKSPFVIAYQGDGYDYNEVMQNNNYKIVNGLIRYQFVRANLFKNRKSVWIQDKNPIGWKKNQKRQLVKVYAFADETDFFQWLDFKSFSVFMEDYLSADGLASVVYNKIIQSRLDKINNAKRYRSNLRRIMQRKTTR